MNLDGVFTALITPFNRDGSVDFGKLDAIVDHQIADGIAGLVPMGTTGESPTLSHEEHSAVIARVAGRSAGKVPIIAGTGSNCTDEAIALTRRAGDAGATMSLQVAPYYNKPSAEGFYRHFTAIADAGGLPCIIYNIPGRSGKNIDNNTMLRLAEHPDIVAVKEASGDIPQVMDLVLRKPDNFTVLSGDDNLGLPIIALGGRGIISVASNLIPEQMSRFVQTALSGDLAAARKEHYRLLPLFQSLFLDTNPIPVKYGMHLMYGVEEIYRLPMCSMSDALKAQFKSVLTDLGLL